MKFTSKHGKLRICDATPKYLEVLFTNADITFPLNRPKCAEVLNLDRGNVDTNMSYSEGPDDPITEPLPLSFSGRIDDTSYSWMLIAALSGATVIGTTNPVVTTKATTTIKVQQTGVATKAFSDASKVAYNVELLYDGATDEGWKLTEVYFPSEQQTITEREDGVILNMNGLIYGTCATMASFTAGTAFAAA